MRLFLYTISTAITQQFRALGGVVWLLWMVLILATANLINPLLALMGKRADKSAVWLRLIERGLASVLRVSLDVWRGALLESAILDEEAAKPLIQRDFKDTILEWKHTQLDWWLLSKGVTFPELRIRIIQAVVLQRRILDLLELFSAVTPPPVVHYKMPVNPPIH